MMTVKGHPGIRKKPNGRYVVTKSINRKRHYKEFETLREATKWKNEFHPLISPNLKRNSIPTTTGQSNGRDGSILFWDVFEQYKSESLSSLTESTSHRKTLRMNKFCQNLMGIRMSEFEPSVITRHLQDQSLLVTKKSRRCNFDKELKDLASIFNWYVEHKDFTFHNPVKKIHYKIGKLKEIVPKDKDMSLEELNLFFSSFLPEEELFEDLAVIQFYLAGRIQEAAAVNDRTVDFKNLKVKVSEKIVWLKGKPVHEFGTKTGATGVVDINEDMLFRLQRRAASRPKGCKYFFHHKGKPLRHQKILEVYNRVLQRAGLFEQYSGTNILRHTMGKISRQIGGLDASQAMLRHKTARMSEHYAKLDSSSKVANVITLTQDMIAKARATRSQVGATICDQSSESVV